MVNAVAHRNYAIDGQAIEIVLYPDRVEFRSPGRLPEPLGVDDLRQQRGVHRSRNPLIMRVLRDLGWTRDQGEGMRRIFGAMSQLELHEPELEESADTFVVRLSTQSLYDAQTQAHIAAYGPFGLMPHERKYVVALLRAGERLSVDRLARSVGETFDRTKERLGALEGKGIVWHAPRSRAYQLVEALSVPHERAFKMFARGQVRLDGRAVLDSTFLREVTGNDDRTLGATVERLKESGILAPVGKGKWRFGASFLEYVRARPGQR